MPMETIQCENQLILAEGVSYSLNDYKTKLNNNVLVVGSSGSGKTRGVIKPNIYQASGSYIISDPKGRLYEEYSNYLKKKGYRIILLDFRNPLKSGKFNPFFYLHDKQSILSMAHTLAFREKYITDPFWNETSTLLLSACIAYLKEECPERMRTFQNLVALVGMMSTSDASSKNELDQIFDRLALKKPESFAAKQFRKVRCCPTKTLQSIIITTQAQLLPFENPELNEMTSSDNVNLQNIGDEKTAIFVVVSDMDRSMDGLANLFFTQAIQELVRHADQDYMGRLPLLVRFLLDDFGTNVCIEEFPRIISSIRSRGISVILVLQSEGQLEAAYGADSETIIGSCDTYVYTGGNDLRTAKAIAEKIGRPVNQIISQPIEQFLIIRRGQTPILAKNYDIDKHKKEFERKQENRSLKDIIFCRQA